MPGDILKKQTSQAEILRAQEIYAAKIIQNTWLAYMCKKTFKLLKHTICAAERCEAYEILRQLCPLEAELIKDPTMNYKVKFRFGGEKFPPYIIFKVFLHNEGHGCKYFSGKNMWKSSDEALVDAYKMMGNRKFVSQMLQDECLSRQFRITNEADIVTKRDYVQYASLIDELPACAGGRNNLWRKLNLENISRTTLIYDIVNYSECRKISDRLNKELKYLLERPKTEAVRQHHRRIVSEVRCSLPSLAITPMYQSYREQNQTKHLGRRSKKALMRVEKMRKAYMAREEETAPLTTEPKKSTLEKDQEIVTSTPAFNIPRFEEPVSDDEWSKEEKELYRWSQNLCFDDCKYF